MTTFKEKFPSMFEEDDPISGSIGKQAELQGWSDLISKFCLDKQRVKEVIEKMFESKFINVNTLKPVVNKDHDLIKNILLENLGLEEETK